MERHDQPKKFQCEICHEMFIYKHTLSRHMLSIHSDYKPHSCHVCQASFARKDSLITHVKTHKTAGTMENNTVNNALVGDLSQGMIPLHTMLQSE